MRESKHSLADLKRLRKQARQPSQPAPPASTAAAGASAPAKPPNPADAPLTDQDVALFRAAVKTAQRLKPGNRQVLGPVPQASGHEMRQRRIAAAGDSADAMLTPMSLQFAPAGVEQDDSRFLRAGIGPDVLRDLQRGKWPVSASLDLHGATLDQAWERLSAFLESCVQHRLRCVRIVHGKGYGSREGTPVLKQTVRRWLAQWPQVQAYVECAERDGGAGAVQVLLPSARNTPR